MPPRVQAAMKECDTNDDGELDRDEWKALSDRSLEAILERHALARGTDDEFIDEFLDMAVIVYDLIDEDMNGTLSKEELVKACGEVSGGVFLRCLQICVRARSLVRGRQSTQIPPAGRGRHRVCGEMPPAGAA